MDASTNSLLAIVNNWLISNGAEPTRITPFWTGDARRGRAVRVEASRATGVIEILFFRHADGMWRVFPQEPLRPVMKYL
ncbi:hypothetical protein B0G80_7507 [Paraburkholderia sp. BL6669N2]|nr:hypothetical protein B0G80_7507 [Paraburkholderia sp. BL6669N2]